MNMTRWEAFRFRWWVWIRNVGGRKINGIIYGRSIARSRRPECRIVIALAELREQGWHDIRTAPTDRNIEVIELDSTGHHIARLNSDGGGWSDDVSHPIMWREPAECCAYQVSDQMICDRCQLLWDVNDPQPPSCEKGIS